MKPILGAPLVGWLLAAAALAGGWSLYRWQGLVFAVTLIAFWLLMQFSRALRAVRNAAGAPVGSLRSAVMLNARLHAGMSLPQVLALTGSLGRKVEAPAQSSQGEETWRWEDVGGVGVSLTFRRSRLAHWELHRPPDGSQETGRAADA